MGLTGGPRPEFETLEAPISTMKINLAFVNDLDIVAVRIQGLGDGVNFQEAENHRSRNFTRHQRQEWLLFGLRVSVLTCGVSARERQVLATACHCAASSLFRGPCRPLHQAFKARPKNRNRRLHY
jgi:hypothetical protein